MTSLGIARAIANIAIFFEFASNDILDEDTAIQVMEQLAHDLKSLEDVSRNKLADGFRSIATSYDEDVRQFVKDLPEAFGIISWMAVPTRGKSCSAPKRPSSSDQLNGRAPFPIRPQATRS